MVNDEWLRGFSKFIEGLILARRLNFRAVELNIDSKVVVQDISHDGRGSPFGSALVQKIRQMLALDWEVVVHHSYRESNKCADALANIGCKLGYGSVVYDRCPTQSCGHHGDIYPEINCFVIVFSFGHRPSYL
jgi:hypothetical protein